MTALVAPLVELPGVLDAVQRARDACDELRTHPAVLRSPGECRAEAAVWAAWASARLDGVDLPVDLVRRAAGGGALPSDAAGRALAGAIRAVAEADQMSAAGGAGLRAVPRALARLHLAAAAGLESRADLGKPLDPGPQARGRLEALSGLLEAQVPALVRVALLDAEVSTAGLFRSANGVVARAAARAAQIGLGLDPTGVAVAEFAMLSDPGGRQTALTGYGTGTVEAVRAWLLAWSGWVVEGSAHGLAVADSILTGRPLTV